MSDRTRNTMNEADRIALIAERDGAEEAEKFVEQGLYLYIMGAIHDSKYKDSIDEYIKFLEEKNKTIEIVKISNKQQ